MGHRSGYAIISSRIVVQMKRNDDICLISVNGKIKQWRFFSQTIQNSSIPSVRDYLYIVCALINAYHNTRVIDPTAERERVAQMFLLLNKGNRLKRRLENLALGRNKPRCPGPPIREWDPIGVYRILQVPIDILSETGRRNRFGIRRITDPIGS